MGAFTREQARSYLLALVAWVADRLIVIVRYGGRVADEMHDLVRTAASA